MIEYETYNLYNNNVARNDRPLNGSDYQLGWIAENVIVRDSRWLWNGWGTTHDYCIKKIDFVRRTLHLDNEEYTFDDFLKQKSHFQFIEHTVYLTKACAHEWVDFQMLKTWCKHCNAEGGFDRDRGVYTSLKGVKQ